MHNENHVTGYMTYPMRLCGTVSITPAYTEGQRDDVTHFTTSCREVLLAINLGGVVENFMWRPISQPAASYNTNPQACS